MKLEEVLPALRAGKKIRFAHGNGFLTFVCFSEIPKYVADSEWATDNWSIVEEPASDEELAAAFEAEAERWDSTDDPHVTQVNKTVARTLLNKAADMVRKRYVDPSWKPADKVGK